ncbi:MAG: hypothetical protein LH610_06720 [Sphingomonas bacterium]|nr:hypothetical protein [Sphingomonas bacterium]
MIAVLTLVTAYSVSPNLTRSYDCRLFNQSSPLASDHVDPYNVSLQFVVDRKRVSSIRFAGPSHDIFDNGMVEVFEGRSTSGNLSVTRKPSIVLPSRWKGKIKKNGTIHLTTNSSRKGSGRDLTLAPTEQPRTFSVQWSIVDEMGPGHINAESGNGSCVATSDGAKP